MTVNQLFREFQKLKLDMCGDFEVELKDLTDEPPVPQKIGSVKILKKEKRVILQSLTLNQVVVNTSKTKQKVAKGSKS